VHFVKTGGVLLPDTYTATLVSGSNAFCDTTGALLDGNGDGTAATTTSRRRTRCWRTRATTLTLPDFARGPTQSVDVLANAGPAGNVNGPAGYPGTPAIYAQGLPISIIDGTGVTSVDFELEYDPTMLTITNVLPITSTLRVGL